MRSASPGLGDERFHPKAESLVCKRRWRSPLHVRQKGVKDWRRADATAIGSEGWPWEPKAVTVSTERWWYMPARPIARTGGWAALPSGRTGGCAETSPPLLWPAAGPPLRCGGRRARWHVHGLPEQPAPGVREALGAPAPAQLSGAARAALKWHSLSARGALSWAPKTGARNARPAAHGHGALTIDGRAAYCGLGTARTLLLHPKSPTGSPQNPAQIGMCES